jgi:hypothetical protein
VEVVDDVVVEEMLPVTPEAVVPLEVPVVLDEVWALVEPVPVVPVVVEVMSWLPVLPVPMPTLTGPVLPECPLVPLVAFVGPHAESSKAKQGHRWTRRMSLPSSPRIAG